MYEDIFLSPWEKGQLLLRDRGNWLKAQTVLTRTNKAGWVKLTSYEVMKMKAVNQTYDPP